MAISGCVRPRALAIQDPLLHRHLSFVALTLQLADMSDDDQALLDYAEPRRLQSLVDARLDGCALGLLNRYLDALSIEQRGSLRQLVERIAVEAIQDQISALGGGS